MDAQQRNQKIDEYGRGFDMLTAALAEIPAEARSYKPSPQDWSVHEIIVHIGDSESMAAFRARKLIAEPGSMLMAYEEAKWADALDYQKQDAEDSLQIIKLARQSTYRLLKLQPDAVFSHTVGHPEFKEGYSFDMWLEIYARHIPDHIEQMQKTYEAWKNK